MADTRIETMQALLGKSNLSTKAFSKLTEKVEEIIPADNYEEWEAYKCEKGYEQTISKQPRVTLSPKLPTQLRINDEPLVITATLFPPLNLTGENYTDFSIDTDPQKIEIKILDGYYQNSTTITFSIVAKAAGSSEITVSYSGHGLNSGYWQARTNNLWVIN